MGTVSIGYGDGYPRSAINGTPVLVQTASGSVRTRMIGRVSMDMITIDLTGIDDAQIDDEVTLWGEGLCADEVARAAGTISYELFCKVTPRVEVSYSE
jgi:alanine racemase